MAKYVYDIPIGVEIKAKYKQIGAMFGKRRILVDKELTGFEKYLVEVRDAEVKAVPEVSTPAVNNKYTKEQLEGMKYKELQVIAKNMGLKYKGKKVELIDRILVNQ